MKRFLKIALGVIIFLTLPSLLFFAFVYFKYNEPIPTGKQGVEADSLAFKIQESLNYEAFQTTEYLEWTFKKRHHFKWYKKKDSVIVFWKANRVHLILDNPITSTVFSNKIEVTENTNKSRLIQKAVDYFNNDSFWLVAPFKLFDPGTDRSIVSLEDGAEGLLVTYKEGGTTPGDTYLWKLDKNYRPRSFKMWVDILPVGGLEATWESWKVMDSGVSLPGNHQLLFMQLDMGGVIAN